jgi:hypothetical protein
MARSRDLGQSCAALSLKIPREIFALPERNTRAHARTSMCKRAVIAFGIFAYNADSARLPEKDGRSERVWADDEGGRMGGREGWS